MPFALCHRAASTARWTPPASASPPGTPCATGGSFVAVTGPDTPQPVRDIAVHTVRVHHDGPRLAELARAVDAGTLPLRVAMTLPLSDAPKAHRLLEKGGLRGRIVLVP